MSFSTPSAARQRRTPGAELHQSVAWALFDSHVTLSSAKPRELFRFDEKAPWQSIDTNANMLQGLVAACGGLVPKQVNLHQHFRTWATQRAALTWSITDTERTVFDLRRSMSHLLKSKRNKRPAPRRYSHLTKLIEMMHLRPYDQEDLMLSDAVAAVPADLGLDDEGAADAPIHADDEGAAGAGMAPLHDIVVSSSDEEFRVPDDDMMADEDWIGDLEASLFPGGATKRRIKNKSKDPTRSMQLMDEAEMSRLMDEALSVEATVPLPADYKAAFKRPAAMLKRPSKRKTIASHRPAARDHVDHTVPTSAAACIEADLASFVKPYLPKSGPEFRKRLHSKIYHTTRIACIRDDSMSEAAAKAAARDQASKGIALWKRTRLFVE